jgi:demethylmenaquinone methyltransferase/2-methoxy-6-polyprenyl-1,4-benzoquinol methylase
MFDDVAPRYDLLNRLISFRLDAYWRRQAVRAALRSNAHWVLDLGSGTGDLSFAAAAAPGRPRIIGLDFSFEMLRLAQQKNQPQRSGARVSFVQGSALAVPLQSAIFDAAISGFVLRNISDLRLFFSEAQRVLKPGGILATLDMFPPPRNWFSALYTVYFYRVVPWIGAALSPRGSAYRYLSKSVQTFHSPEAIAGLIKEAGFQEVSIRKFLRGAVCLHTARKAG